MRLIDLGYPRGKFSDVQHDPLGWVAVLQDDTDGALRLVQLTPDGERRVPDTPIDAGGGAAFPRLWVDPVTKHTWLAWRHETKGGMLVDLTGNQWIALGVVHGNGPIALGAGLCWYQATSGYALRWRDLAAPGVEHPTLLTGRPTGLAGVDAHGDPVLVDSVRLSVPGMVNPQSAGRCVVGEADRAGGPCNVARLIDGREAVIWPGLISNTPRIATDAAAFAVTAWGGPGVRVALLTDPPDFREPVPEPPPEDRWALVPDGTPVTKAWRSLFGDAPSISDDGKRIYFAKNQPPQGEWRELAKDGTVYHLFDQSRGEDVPTGPRKGWYLTPRDCCKWAKDTFTSGESFTVHGEKVEADNGARVRWTHTVTLYGLKAGGVMVRFDPRFPGMYEPAGYEHHYNRNDGGVRWEFIVTPVAAKGVIPWGDPSMDVIRQEAEDQARPGQPTPAYVEAPRLSVDSDPWAKPTTPQPKPPEPPMSQNWPPLKAIPRDQVVMMQEAIDGYLRANPRLGLPAGLVDVSAPALAQQIDALIAYGVNECLGHFQEEGPLPGTAEEYAARRQRAQDYTVHVIESERGEHPPQPPVTPPSGSFRRIAGALRRDGKHFMDDHGYISPRGASCLYGLCDGVDASALLQQYADEGIQYVRVFAGALPRVVNGADRGYEQTPEAARARLPQFLANANVRGLRVQVCMITDSALVQYDVYGHARECARIVGLSGNWLEGGNEIEDGEQDHSIDWRRVEAECRSVGYAGLFTVGAGALDELDASGKYWPAEIGDFASTHPWRGHEVHWMADGCRLREGEGISATYDKPIAFGEPDNGSKQPEGYAFLIGALGAGFNAAVVYHSTPGRDIHIFEGDELAKLRAFVQGHQALEAGPWGFQNAQRPGNWPDSPVVAGAFEEGDYGPPHMLPGGHVWRVFSFEKDGRGFSVPTGHRPELVEAFTIGNGRRQGPDRGSRQGVRLVEISR